MFRPALLKNLFVQLSKGNPKDMTAKLARALGKSAPISESFKVKDWKDWNVRVKSSKTPVIVDFFATWCNPCRLLTPRVEKIIEERQGKVLLAKVDIDENTDLALDYEISSVPVLLAMDNGEVVDKLVGLQDEDKIRTFVDKILRENEEEQQHKDVKKANPK